MHHSLPCCLSGFRKQNRKEKSHYSYSVALFRNFKVQLSFFRAFCQCTNFFNSCLKSVFTRMGRIKISHVVNYTSQDERYPVENVINNTEKNLSKKWLSSPFDKSRRLEAEFQFECSSSIHYIDIGNSGSCTVELHVGSSAWPRSQPYISLLSSISFMTFADIKAGASPSGVKMFNKEDMDKISHCQKYDRIRVICHQPYMKPLQFGLSFLNLRNNETDLSLMCFKPEEFYAKNATDSISLPLSDRIGMAKTYPLRSWHTSRGHKLVDLALSNKTATTPKQSEEEELDDFEIKVTLFMTSRDADGVEFTLNECEEQFEESNMISLTVQQKDIFKKVYCSVFPHAASSRTSPFSSSPKGSAFSPPKDYSNIRRKGGKRLQQRAPSPVTMFDVDFSPKRARRSLTKSYDEENHGDDRSNGTSLPSHTGFSPYTDSNGSVIIDLANESSPSANANFYRADDFVQFDGSVPSTSKDTSYVNCPICSKQFHITEIETHAASCEDFSHPNLDDSEDDEDMNSSVVLRPKNILLPYHLTKC